MQLPSEDGALVTTAPSVQAFSTTHTRTMQILIEVVPVVRIERTTYRLQGGCSAPELNRQWPELCAYLIRRNVGLPPEGFFGSGAGAGSAAGGFVLVGTASDSPFAWTLGFAPSMSKVMPWPVSRA